MTKDEMRDAISKLIHDRYRGFIELGDRNEDMDWVEAMVDDIVEEVADKKPEHLRVVKP